MTKLTVTLDRFLLVCSLALFCVGMYLIYHATDDLFDNLESPLHALVRR